MNSISDLNISGRGIDHGSVALPSYQYQFGGSELANALVQKVVSGATVDKHMHSEIQYL